MDLLTFSSLSGIVASTMVAVEIIKRLLGNVPRLRRLPTWIYAVLVSAGLTAASAAAGWLTEPGPWYAVALKAVGLAATASGFWTWLREPGDQLQDSDRAMAAKRAAAGRPWAGLVLAGVLASTAASCAKAPSPTPAADNRQLPRTALMRDCLSA